MHKKEMSRIQNKLNKYDTTTGGFKLFRKVQREKALEGQFWNAADKNLRYHNPQIGVTDKFQLSPEEYQKKLRRAAQPVSKKQQAYNNAYHRLQADIGGEVNRRIQGWRDEKATAKKNFQEAYTDSMMKQLELQRSKDNMKKHAKLQKLL